MLGDILYKKALKLAQKKHPNDKKVFELLERSLAKNNPLAMYAMGTWYLHGYYVKKDIKKDFNLISAAAQKNVPDDCFDLAIFYEKGNKVKKNKRKAFSLYMRGALYGDKLSFYEVGRCFNYGIGVAKNTEIAKIWYEISHK